MRTFLTVVEHNSFSAASQQLNLVTSAVSRQVSDLENYYNCQLLYRTTRSMHLTADGEFYREQFENVLAQLDQLETDSHQRLQKIAGHLRITTPLNSNLVGMQDLFAQFCQHYPEVNLSWMLVNRYVNLVEEGVDLAIRAGELEDSSLIGRQFGKIMVQFVAHPDYLAKHGTPAHPKDLQRHKCLLDSSTTQPGRWNYMDNGRERHITVNGPIDVNSGSMVAEFAARGSGIARLPSFMISRYLEAGTLVSILEDYQLPPTPISLVYPANRSVNPALKTLVQFLLENRPNWE